MDATAAETLDAGDVPAQFERLVRLIGTGRSPVVVERRGVPVAAIVSIEDLADLARLRRQREDAEERAAIAELQRLNADKDPDEVLADVTAVVEEVRREMREEEARLAAGRR